MLVDTLRNLKALLQNQLPAKLDQIELERADGVTLEDIQSFFIELGSGSHTSRQGGGAARHLDARLGYPNVTILGEATSANNAISRRRELRHEVSVWITDREVSPDSELAQTKLLYYVEAVERVLAGDPSLGGKAINSTVTSHVYLRKGREEFVRRAILSMEVLEMHTTSSY
ncbi:MAG: hypothetical protein A3E19_03710 [Planctomycetes bacterium RIFCSPHIGHO2_12_FULL_52_36]|nr:MAG: hypothetical protein A3D89_05860 [Planctomycetes bacterium RIFCSPHIGHO2_02_FULL_52_58]OHB93112.1 MAG: hypothetical protein A3E19_03710 [Planctomycetes bacterium RIFCSPHIGHO2_12_FULL_52_36]